jgi:hypothetical protein
MFKGRAEETLHKAVAQQARWSLARDCFWFHPPNGGSRNVIEATKLKAMGTRAGVPDLVFVRHGKAYFIELKAPKGRVSEAQSGALTEIQRAGAPVAICRNLDDVLACWRKWGLTNTSAAEDAARRVA